MQLDDKRARRGARDKVHFGARGHGLFGGVDRRFDVVMGGPQRESGCRLRACCRSAKAGRERERQSENCRMGAQESSRIFKQGNQSPHF